jgi:hypothetical protein
MLSLGSDLHGSERVHSDEVFTRVEDAGSLQGFENRLVKEMNKHLVGMGYGETVLRP